jgi:CDP-4-dehydro-6-deoxyglucose reductase
MPLITLTSGKNFQSQVGSTLLQSAEQANISLLYSCKNGRCSTCKCKVLAGKTYALGIESGLSSKEQEDGWILSCMRSAETDLLLEIDDLVNIKLPLPNTLPCKIKEIKLLATDDIKVILRLPPTSNFQFIPGQYVEVIGPNGTRRSYSLANFTASDNSIEMHIRAISCGVMTDYWFNQAKQNDLLRIRGPFGTFFLRESFGVDLYFLATGTGISPVKAILDSLANIKIDQRPKSVTLIWGGRNSQDLYLEINSTLENFLYVPVHSRPNDYWNGAKGYVQNVLLNLSPNLTNAFVYACGSDSMIKSTKSLLADAGLPRRRFYADAFVSSGDD